MAIYEHFREDERPFVDQVLDWKDTAVNEYRPRLTDFLDPRQQQVVKLVVGNQEGVNLSFWGGREETERKRALIYPDYFSPAEDDFHLACFELEYPSKFVTLEHRQILGALMGIGLKREKFGDILTDGKTFQLVVSGETSDFVKLNFNSAGKAKISLKEINADSLIKPEVKKTERFVTVSSLRLDVVAAEAFNMSRSKIKPVITGENVKVNWKVTEDPSYILAEGDTLSVRGKGRCEIGAVEGETKKGKLRLILEFPE